MNISYVVLGCLLLCFLALTAARLGVRFRGVRESSQSSARKQAPQIDAKESLRRMIEDRYGSSWRNESTGKGKLR